MYKIILIIALLLSFIGCKDTSTDLNTSALTLSFNPMKIVDIKYNNENKIGSLAVDGNTYVISNAIDSFTLGKVNPSGSYEAFATLNANAGERYGALTSIDKSYVLIGDKSPNTIFLFKISEDKSVKQIATIEVENPSSSITYAGNMLIKDNIIAVTELREDLDVNLNMSYDHKIVLFRVESNESVTRVQELKSDLVDANASSNFGEDFTLSSDILAVAERCYIHLYKKDENGTFVKSDSITFAEFSGDDQCYLNLGMKNNHLVAQSHNLRRVFFYQLKGNKFKTSQEIIPEERYRNFGLMQAFINNNIILSTINGLTIYKIEDLASESLLTKFSDINISVELLSASEKYFLATERFSTETFSIFDAYPLNQIFVYSDINSTIKVDEGAVYSLYNINANSPAKDLSYSLSGMDASYFEIDGNTLKNSKIFNFNNPIDADANNIYELFLRVEDRVSNILDIKLNIAVVDREYMFSVRKVADDSTNYTQLGRDIFVDGSDVLVGAEESAYIFDANSSLKQIVKFNSDSNQSNSNFGNSVAKNGLVVLIAASLEDINDTDQGSVMLYNLEENKSIRNQFKIISPLLEKYAHFGSSLDIENNITAIGADGYSYSYRESGKVFLYNNEANGSITYMQTLLSGDPKQLDYFGASLDIDGEYIIVGSPGHSLNNISAVGAAYLYKRQTDNSFKLIDSFAPNTTLYGQSFASKVAMSGEYIVIGAASNNDVYIFKLDITGEHADRITTIHNATVDGFGTDVSISGKDIFIANRDSTVDRVDHYKIEDNDTVLLKEAILNHSDVLISSNYASVAQGENFALSGASLADINATDSGVITLFEK